jgi:hypothetical protein
VVCQLLAVVTLSCGSHRIPRTGLFHLPPGVVELHSPLAIPAGAHDLEITGSPSTILRAAEDFKGRALIQCFSGRNIRIHGFSIDGNRTVRETFDMAPPENAFRLMYNKNGLWFDQSRGIIINNLKFQNITSFAVLISRSSDIQIDHVSVSYSGSLDARGQNNSTGGIVIEEASSNFHVRNCTFRHILGNGLWTHSLYTSERNRNGRFEVNEFDTIGRDAIQIGHATRINVMQNNGRRIGYPSEYVDAAHEAFPVAIDTAGNVDESTYGGNSFEEIDGKCIDLDGFHDGDVVGNTCINRGRGEDYPYGHFALVMNDSNPNMHPRNVIIGDNEFNGAKFGGIYVVGGPHTIQQNRLLNLNLAHCNENPAVACLYYKDQPDLLRSGIYLGTAVHKQDQTRGNVIHDNRIEGYKIREHCIAAAPSVPLAANAIDANQCRDTP